MHIVAVNQVNCSGMVFEQYQKTIMKTSLIVFSLLCFQIISAQKTNACDAWLTDFVQVEPKVGDGEHIDKYVVQKLLGDSSLKEMATCMVGVKIYANCKGEFSYEKQNYRNNPALNAQCKLLLKKTEHILNGIKVLVPATIAGKEKDFAFKVVVRVKRNGDPVAEVLF